MSDQDLQQKEDAGVLDDTAADFSPQEKSEYDKLAENDPEEPDDQVGKGFTGDKNQKKKFWSGRKKKGGILAIATITSITGALSIIGPGLTVSHLRNLLLGNELQVSHSRRYRRTHFSKMSDAFTSDGRRGGKIINEMESRGYKFSFDPNDRKKIRDITLPNQTVSIQNLDDGALADHIQKYMDVHHPLRTSRWKTKRMEAFYTRYKVGRTAVTARVNVDVDDPERTVNKGIAEQVDGAEPNTRVSGLDEVEGETADERTAREADYNESADFAKSNGGLDDIKAKLRSGVPVDELTSEEQLIIQVSSRVDEELMDLLNNIGTGSVAGTALKTAKAWGSSTDILDKICTMKNRLRAISFAARNYRALSLIRYAAVFIKAGDGIRTGNTDPKLLNEVMKRTTALDSNGNSIGGSPGFAYLIKNKFSRSKNEVSKSNVSVDGTLTGTAGALQQATDGIPGTSRGQCGVYQNPVFQIGVAVVEIGVAIFSGGSSTAATGAYRITVKQAINQSIRRIISKQTARALVKTIAVELSFEGALTLLQYYSEKADKLNFTNQEVGGELGDVLGAGSGTLSKQRGLQAGFVPATTQQYALAQNQYITERNENYKQMSFYDRIANYNNPDSLAYSTASQLITAPANVNGIGIGIQNNINNVASVFTNPFKLMNGLFANTVSAQDTDEISFEELKINNDTLATDPAGNLLPIMRQDILDIDPVKNQAELVSSGDIDSSSFEPKSDNFKEHVVNCVDSVDTLSTLEHGDQSSPKNDCLAKLKTTTKFKAHLAWLDMQDSVDAGLFPEEIVAQTTPSPTSDSSTPAVGNTSDVPCASGTNDVGLADGYSVGKKYIIRLCEIPGFTSNSSEDINDLVRVNSTVSGKWLNVFSQAQDSNIALSANSSFRTMKKQISLYGCYKSGGCNNGNVAAKPGFSNHQIGFAIDIDITPGKDPSLTSCEASPSSYPVYQWLAANAPLNGINGKVPSECWHWSVSGT